MAKKRTVSPTTGHVPAEFKLRVCGEHLYPVGLISETSGDEFVCLLRFHRMGIESTRVFSSNLTELLPKMMGAVNWKKLRP